MKVKYNLNWLQALAAYTVAPIHVALLGKITDKLKLKRPKYGNKRQATKHIKWYFKHCIDNGNSWAKYHTNYFKDKTWQYRYFFRAKAIHHTWFPTHNVFLHRDQDLINNLIDEVTKMAITEFYFSVNGYSAKD